MNNPIAITGFGLALGGYENQESFFQEYISEREVSPSFKEVEKFTALDGVMDRYITSLLGKTLTLNRFLPVTKKERNLRTYDSGSYQACLATKEALKKANLLRIKGKKREKIGIVFNTMYAAFNFNGKDELASIKRHWEQLSPNFIGHTFNIRGPQFVYRESENAGLRSIHLVSKLIDPEKMPIVLINGLSKLHPTFTRIDVLEEIQSLMALADLPQNYILPTKHSEAAVSIILEDYAHAQQRGVKILATLDSVCQDKYHPDFSRVEMVTNSISKTLLNTACTNSANGGTPKKHYDMIFGSFNQNFVVDRGEYNAFKQIFPKAAIICSRRIYGRCAPIAGLLDVALALWGFETGKFPKFIERADEILNEEPIGTQRVNKTIGSIMIQSLSRPGTYANVSITCA